MTVQPVATSRVQSAIQLASARTGVDFDYLMGQAKLESGFNAGARARTSSATGLYQFIESSWLSVVKKHGAEHGLGWAAEAIGPGGRVADAGTRSAILALRNDPNVASLMAAEHASDNKTAIEGSLGREATGTDLYMAHFLGLGGARKFLSKLEADPGASAASLFPAAARANRTVFFAPDGSPRTLAQVYGRFANKLGSAASSAGRVAVDYAAQALEMDGSTVVTGAGESARDALAWASSTLGRYTGRAAQATMLRPTPDTARLAYLMLAQIGN
ncbi:MAG TPA: lytic transglycosylase domain-containing protein [Sphingomonas sp.]|jgi:hypothetical protein